MILLSFNVKAMNDQMNFAVDQAKLQQAYELAQQRQSLQENIADDRNDVNIYRINTGGMHVVTKVSNL